MLYIDNFVVQLTILMIIAGIIILLISAGNVGPHL